MIGPDLQKDTLLPREDWIVALLLTEEEIQDRLGNPSSLTQVSFAHHALNSPVRYAVALSVGPGRRQHGARRPCETRMNDLIVFTDQYERLSRQIVMVRERHVEAILSPE